MIWLLWPCHEYVFFASHYKCGLKYVHFDFIRRKNLLKMFTPDKSSQDDCVMLGVFYCSEKGQAIPRNGSAGLFRGRRRQGCRLFLFDTFLFYSQTYYKRIHDFHYGRTWDFSGALFLRLNAPALQGARAASPVLKTV